jgi:branched-chain amino acid transport system substrate-binding protein
VLDDGGSPRTSGALLTKLLDQKAQLLLGSYQDSLVTPQEQLAETAGVPYVYAGSALQSYAGTHWTFGILSPTDLLAYSILRWVDVLQNTGKLPKQLKIAVLHENTEHGDGFRRGVLDFAEKTPRRRASYQVVFDEGFPFGAPDAKSLMRKLKASGADVLLADAHLVDFIALHREYVAQGLCHVLVTYGARGREAQAAATLGAANVQGLISTVWWSSNVRDDDNRKFLAAWQKRYGDEPEWYGAVAYQAARTLFSAVESAGSTDREAVRKALSTAQFPSILPGSRLAFQNGQANSPFIVEQNDGAATRIVYPLDWAESPGVVKNCR